MNDVHSHPLQNDAMETDQVKQHHHQTSSPKEFFKRLYGHLEDSKCALEEKPAKNSTDVVTPVPILASPFQFFLPTSNEAHLTAAAAGLSAFCKILITLLIFLLHSKVMVLQDSGCDIV